jgi:8-oxo-dGTP pyrophosphatase MutT (NUDIX family)
MRQRPTVRVLLLGPDDRILLIRFHDRRLNDAKVFWATVGGGLDPGEGVVEGALREVREETGLTDVVLGPIVWTDDVVIMVDGEPLFFHEQYIVARTATTALSSAEWTELEREAITELRWWTVEEIRNATEQVYPEMLADWLPDILTGNYPPEVRAIPRPEHQRRAPGD